jgi:hypothetical protein
VKTFKIDFLESYDDEAILQELKRIAKITGQKTLTKQDIKNTGRLSYTVINKHFGSLRKALQKAGLIPRRFMKAKDGELMEILVELWERTLAKEGRRPFGRDLKTYGYPVSSYTYKRRFGSWKKALMRAYNSVNDTNVNEVNVLLAPETIQNKDKRPKTREHLSLRKRFFVLKRDQFTCRLCGASGLGVPIEVDHIVPKAKGGTDSMDNLQTLCFKCNRGKRDTI